MSRSPSQERVARLREARKAAGMRETNVWLTEEMRERIAKEVEAGRFRNQHAAINHALDQTFGANQ